MKKIIVITMLSLLTGLVSAQIVLDKPIKKSIVQNDVRLKTQVSAAKYNGAVVGYALACKLDENKIRIVQDEFKKRVGDLKLIPDKQLALWKEYETVANEKRILEITKNECKLFEEEFTKIINKIKTGN